MADIPKPTSGRLPLIDTHCHLNHPRLWRRLDEVLTRARASGVSAMVVVGYDLPSSRAAVELAARHKTLWAAVGVHPHDAKDLTSDIWAELRALAESDRVVAIGETGLDFYRDLSPRPVQQEWFVRHLDLAEELALPTIIHCREAQQEVLTVVRSRGSQRLLWHCFDGTAGQAAEAVARGMMLGFGGRVTHHTGRELLAIAATVPLERLLLETDAPYLSPEPVRSKDNEPANLPFIAEAIARARGVSPAGVAAATTQHASMVFNLEGSIAG